MTHPYGTKLIFAAVICGLLFFIAAVLVLWYPAFTEAEEPILQPSTVEPEAPATFPSVVSDRTEPPPSLSATAAPETETTEIETAPKPLIVIDPGHQLHGDYDTEPIGPGADQQKPRVSSGTQGVITGLPEHELNLTISLMLRDLLTDRGYEVHMIRETPDVSLSNAERAQVANDLEADAFIRIHANSDSDESVHGAMTICMTPSNPYNGSLYEESKRLSHMILLELCNATDAKNRSVWETDTMSGINWSTVPVAIVEMGFMSNPEEDGLLSDPAYQARIVQGIANGLDRYFSEEQT